MIGSPSFELRRDPWWDAQRGRASRDPRRSHAARAAVVLAVIALAATALLRPAAVRAGVSVNLDQFATLDAAWQNGNLNGNNARFPEGGIVPFRLAIEGLKAGNHTIHINYDFTAGGHKAYDFLATWNAWAKPKICGGAGGGISSMCPSLPTPSSAAFPSDPYTADGLSVNAAEIYSGVSRRLTIWGGTITSISRPRHSGSPAANSSADITVKFRSTGKAVLLAWGGHLAQSAFWNRAAGGERDGAGEVSGAPWHMRTLGLDGAGARNQDRSIQPSAIVGELPPRALAPPTPRPATPPPAAPPAATNPPVTPPGTAAPAGPAGPTGPRITPPPTATATVPIAGDSPVTGWLLVLAATAGALVVAAWRPARSRRSR